jgi:GTP-binding protein
VIDTGGLDPTSEEPLTAQVRKQVLAAIAEADALVFVLDGREGLTPLDQETARLLRRVAKPVVVAVNKIDARANEAAAAEIYGLGMEPVLLVSAEHGRGVAELIEALAMRLPSPPGGADDEPGPIRIAVVGRPNVGKSSLVNAIAGQDRVVVHSEPGTTRDAVDTLVTVEGRPYILVDTAGLRRKGAPRGRRQASAVGTTELGGGPGSWSSTRPKGSPRKTPGSRGTPRLRAAPSSSWSTSGTWSGPRTGPRSSSAPCGSGCRS